MPRILSVAAAILLLVGLVTVFARDGEDEQVAAPTTSSAATPSDTPSTDLPSTSSTASPTPDATTPSAIPTATSTPSATSTPTPTPTQPDLPEATPVDPGSVGQLGPGRWLVALLRGGSFSFTIPEGQTYDVQAIPATNGEGNLGVVLLQPSGGGATGVAVYTAYGVGAVRDGAPATEGFDDVPGSWATFPGFTITPQAAADTLGGQSFAVIDWVADLQGQEPYPGRGAKADLFAFDRAEDGAPQYTFADDGDRGSSWFTLIGPRAGEAQVAVVADAFVTGSPDPLPPQHDELRRSIALVEP